MSPTTIRRTLEEIHLLQCSLLPGELLLFTDDAAHWRALLDAYALDPDDPALDDPAAHNTAPAHFQVRLEASSAAWFDVVLPRDYGAIPARGEERVRAAVSVKGDGLGRAEQERWHAAVEEARAGVEEGSGSEYPLYEALSAHLLPQLHAALEASQAPPPSAEASLASDPDAAAAAPADTAPWHALFVTHHLKSPTKRRLLAQWAHELALVGFAKVGHPGVIYVEGAHRAAVEDFVARVRGMQWLALRLRFVEALPGDDGDGGSKRTGGQRPTRRGEWKEFEKVGEVVDEMRRLGRERFVVEMGIGSAGLPTSSK